MKKTRKISMRKRLTDHIKQNKAYFAVYVVLRVFVIISLVLSLLQGNYESAFTCALTLVLFLAPAFIEENFGIDFPTVMEIIILCFIFAAEILGELQSFYVRVAGWDTMLHTLNGFLCAAVGFSLVDIFNRNEKFSFKLSPMFLAIVAFCFSMTIGVMWELFECASDMLVHTDMQKDMIISDIYTVTLDPTNSNQVIAVNGITSTSVNGTPLNINGYLDVGLYDTMKDLFVNFIGAVVFSAIGYVYVKTRGRGKIAKNFIPVVHGKDPSKEDLTGEKN